MRQRKQDPREREGLVVAYRCHPERGWQWWLTCSWCRCNRSMDPVMQAHMGRSLKEAARQHEYVVILSYEDTWAELEDA